MNDDLAVVGNLHHIHCSREVYRRIESRHLGGVADRHEAPESTMTLNIALQPTRECVATPRTRIFPLNDGGCPWSTMCTVLRTRSTALAIVEILSEWSSSRETRSVR